ncbi:N-acetyl-gamma-glutamyl-phosphate reductase [Commensalibacter papalotli (ex Botero et al. 2024)]|uniref:N-acetyl-gamma-glutamyl-phosphate reductase n=1 Tax=Commensalibacter papalotli (ex Botero et al. 2024) TaxID=2972766 RepID=A0ABM9HLI1_9PROT|nr:N-acetyl-gamma-glutamyl-phosphate reductase [Commensalibacter papalotli (ex Botero et al. 2024)]CAI3934267.1 N-acetyl-gamma-glutamylphosphate reductase (ArgC) (PDB:3DR3) [Commensalibacter papalotli (ex Botero et al. 2024)]CAI3950352.1 N-acetyl-gamma-glutamylphosphate reductase (ArgC) (PDB:3DR3) [Commensalibacter papalotli (ex Botero et al. 2024)]
MSKMPKIFIDGEYGTTGLGIRQRLEKLPVQVCSIPVEKRHDMNVRLDMMAQMDLVVLCLPDDASRESVAAIQSLSGHQPKILDASTAFRTNPAWVYGFAELDQDQAAKIKKAPLVANPGCYSSGAIALLHPLVQAEIMDKNYPVTINAISGYSGGGKQMIASYEVKKNAPPFMLYGLNLQHKHLPEIVHYAGLSREPIFVPSVGNFAQGMIVSVPLHLDILSNRASMDDIKHCLQRHYVNAEKVSFVNEDSEKLSGDQLALTDKMELRVHSNARQDMVVLTAIFDNLGKGASGAAIQNIRLMLGV